MIDYVDPIPPILKFYNLWLPDIKVAGNSFYPNITLPALLVKSAGGIGYSRIQLVARADDDISAMQTLIKAMNLMERYASNINGLRVVWCSRESNPIPSVDSDTNKPEAWCYMKLEHLEA